jgi:hypothetical protein
METTRMVMPAPRFRRRPCASALVLLAVGILLAPSAAWAQFNPQDLLKQVLPGAGQQNRGDAASAGERACQRYAEDRGLDVRRVLETRRSGNNNLEVMLSVEDRNDRYEARCVYDSGDGEVRELEAVSGTTQARDRRGDDEVDERLARRARDACENLARDRDFESVDVEGVRARGRDTVEVAMRARVRGDRRDFTCLYDNDQRRARVAE